MQDYAGFEQEVLAEHRDRLAGMLAVGQSVILDYGFPTREQRETYKDLIKENGGTWRLLYFQATYDTLWQRIEERNIRRGANAQPISKSMLRKLVDNFEVPEYEGEEIIELD
jgi:predicted kinase